METQASEIMSSEVLTCTAETTVEEALKTMINNRITGMPVVDATGKMIGVVSETDMIKLFASAKDVSHEFFVQPIPFSTQFTAIRENTMMSEVLDVFVSTRTRRLPVLDQDSRLIGIVSKRDLMKVFYYRSRLV